MPKRSAACPASVTPIDCPKNSVAANSARLLPRCADADMALNNLERFFANAGPGVVATLLESRARTLETVLQLFGTSQYFSDLLVAHPDYVDMLRVPLRRSPSQKELQEQLQAEVDAAFEEAAVLRAFRRFRQRQIDYKTCAGLFGLLDAYVAAHALDALFHNRQSDAGSWIFFVMQTLEQSKHSFAVLFGNADAIILDLNARHFAVDEPITLNHMQCRAEGCSKSVDHRKRSDLLALCVDHQRGALIAAY